MEGQQGHAVKFALFFVKSKHLCLAQKLSNQNILLTFKWKVENSTALFLFCLTLPLSITLLTTGTIA